MNDSKMPAAVPITGGDTFHFFGYYDKFQVDATGTRMLTMETDFMDRMPTPEDAARIGVIDLADNNRLDIVAETTAWCWQQSCMLQWLASAPDRKIIFNIRDGDHFAACVLDIRTGRKRVYDRPIYSVSADGRFAVCPNFSRLATLRPGYGYEGVPDPWADQTAAEDDGIYRLDLETGESRLIISLAQIADYRLAEQYRACRHWLNHLLISPDGRRFIFLHRGSKEGEGRRWFTRMFTANVDGTDIHLLNDHEMTSHFIWRDERTVVAWAKRFDTGTHYYSFTDRTDDIRTVAPDKLVADGHMSYRPQRDWMITDTYPRAAERKRALMLYNDATDELIELGRFYADATYDGYIRTDLHPRWNRDGTAVTFDSIHEGVRQIYMVDVSSITRP